MNAIFTKITLLVLLLLPVWAMAQTDDFYQLKSYNYINDLAVDSQYIWAATTSGVVQRNKLTGEICGIFNASNSPLKSEDVTSVAIDSMGQKWFGTRNGFVYSFDDFEWEEEDSLIHKVVDLAFAENNQMVEAIFESSYSNYCGLNLRGTYTLFQQENGQLWSHYRNSICQGSTSGCSCHKFHQHFRKWNGTDWEIIWGGELYEIIMSGFIVDSNDDVWTIKDSTLNHFQFSNNELNFIESIDLGIGELGRIKYQSDDLFWISSPEGLFTFDGNALTPAMNGLDGNSINLIFDTNNQLFGFNSSGIYQYVNNEWQLFPNSIRPSLGSDLTFAKNGDVWFANNDGMTRYDANEFEYFTIDNSVLIAGTNEIIHADSQSGIWLNKIDENEAHRLFYYNGQDWLAIDENNSGLSSLNFSDIATDSLGRIWFIYANPTQDSVARFDYQEWVNFSNLDSFNAAFNLVSIPDKWFFSTDLGSMLKIENGDTTTFPIDVFPFGTTDLLLGSALVSQEGYAWVKNYNPFTGGSDGSTYMLHFDGENWIFSGGWYLQTVKYAFYRGNKAWFFNEDTVPGNDGTSGSGHYYDGGAHTKIEYPANCGGAKPLGINIIDLIEFEDSYLMLCELSMFTLGGASSSVCSSRFLIKMTGATFEILSIENQNGITRVEIDLDNNIWAYYNGSIATNRPLSPILKTFSKPTLCNTGRALACVTAGGLSPFNYQWNDGTTNPLKAPVNPGNYDVTVTDANATTQSSDLEVGGQGTFIDVQAAVFPISCAGEDDGQIEAVVSGGTPPYQYLWADGAMQPLIEFLPPNEYALTVTDGEGCVVDYTTTLTEPAELMLNLTSETPVSGESNGSVTTAVSGGTPPFNYLWNTGENTPDLVNISGGNYSLTVTDAAACTIEFSFYLYETALDDDTGMNLQTNTGGNQQEAIIFKQKRSNKISRDAAVVVFPNPFQNTLFINLKNSNTAISNLQIYNVFGQKMPFILNENGEEGILKIETSEWSSGAYFIHYQVNSEMLVQKVIKR